MHNCLFCNEDVNYRVEDDSAYYDCPKCGIYTIGGSLEASIKNGYQKRYVKKISSWISEQNIVFGNKNVFIDEDTIEKVILQPDKKMKDKFDCVVKFIFNNTYSPINKLNHCYLNKKEFNQIFLQLEIKKYIIFTRVPEKYHYSNMEFSCNLTYDGIEYLESLEQTNINSKNLFVAFYFTEELQNIFDKDISFAIKELGYNYVRVSTSTTDLDTTINDEIIAKIRSAKLVIADFTGQRNSVYFEAGLAMGLNIPVIWTCRSSDVKKLAFDTRQYPHIIWEQPKDLVDKIINRIKALP